MTILCRSGDIAEGRARGFSVPVGGRPLDILVVLWRGELCAYENRCPHQGTTLDWLPDNFMSLDGRHLQCATHGARFDPATGICVRGPCEGKSLRALPIAIDETGAVRLGSPD